jgi:hypothetical protein
MRVAAVSQQRNLVRLGHPCRQRITITDLPIQQVRGTGYLLNSRPDSRVDVGSERQHVVDVAVLEPRLFDLHVLFVGELSGHDNVDFLSVP